MTGLPASPESPPAAEPRPGEVTDLTPPPSVEGVVGHIAPPADPLGTQIRRVVEARAGAEIFAAKLAQARATFDAANAELIGLAANAKRTVDAEEDTLRRLAVEQYERTENKAPAPGVGIKIVQKITYTEDAALTWARENGLALALDRKAFDAIAKSNPLPFVTKTELAVATLAKDLAVAAGDA